MDALTAGGCVSVSARAGSTESQQHKHYSNAQSCCCQARGTFKDWAPGGPKGFGAGILAGHPGLDVAAFGHR
jgi:hypothetical protein